MTNRSCHNERDLFSLDYIRLTPSDYVHIDTHLLFSRYQCYPSCYLSITGTQFHTSVAEPARLSRPRGKRGFCQKIYIYNKHAFIHTDSILLISEHPLFHTFMAAIFALENKPKNSHAQRVLHPKDQKESLTSFLSVMELSELSS